MRTIKSTTSSLRCQWSTNSLASCSSPGWRASVRSVHVTYHLHIPAASPFSPYVPVVCECMPFSVLIPPSIYLHPFPCSNLSLISRYKSTTVCQLWCNTETFVRWRTCVLSRGLVMKRFSKHNRGFFYNASTRTGSEVTFKVKPLIRYIINIKMD